MSFPLVHFRSHLFLYDKNDHPILDINSNYMGGGDQSIPTHDCLIELSYNFSNQSSPSDTQVTIHNLTKQNADKFQKGCTVSIWAGWMNSNWTESNVSHIFTSTINTVSPLQNSSGDWQMSFTCQDGNKFSGETALSKKFKQKSKSVRSNSSDSRITLNERRQLNDVSKWMKDNRLKLTSSNKHFTNNISGAKKKLAAERKDGNADITTWAKNQRAKLKEEYPTVPGGRGSGSTAINKAHSHSRKLAGEQITAQAKQKRNTLKSKINKAEKALNAKRSSHRKATTSRRNHISKTGNKRKAKIRTRANANKQKQRRAKTKNKTKSKKTTTTGKHFAKNSTGRQIIRTLAKLGHIHITSLKLVKNHRFTSGYTATKTPWQEIQTVAQDYCNSNIWWPHGELYIGNFAQHTPMNFTLTPNTGLTQSPEEQDDDDDDSDSDSSTKHMIKAQRKQQRENEIANPKTYEVDATFLPWVTTGSEFRIVDPAYPSNDFNADGALEHFSSVQGDQDMPLDVMKTGGIFNDEVVVQSGTLEFGQDQADSELTVVKSSDLAKKQKQSDNQRAEKAKQAADKKDAKKRKRAKAKRAKRTKARKAKKTKKPSTSTKSKK